MSDERAGFETLFRETRAPLLAYLSRRAPVDDAPDLLAEVYLVAWRRRADLPAGDERRLWLFGVARRLLAEHHRAAWTRSDVEDEAGRVTTPGPDTAGSRREDAVRRALDSLSDVDRELITLTTWERLSPAEAARVVGITANTARVRLHRARARLGRHPALRALLDDDAGDPVHDTVVGTAADPAPAR
ncbi:RNA polymerase sigma factor [Modestobacter roseus]|uniref:RNA polymerase sigma-70 factor (ECF subfamily) n=1 Tax=Modestobacter roseus TaxID=1181884 RepID=A0A562ISK3_9ACTN|nr:sigma-70 family RNA polymerase sigma factor [Modestobacter roseus]MQA36124.1 sigma-70 family RNA polymerase sigma factor [Modestobacter roseus]TWH74009.1 RNA polymerase sigma-70 factor (ECF subfamily) [Modestobacter roseus]